MVVRIDQMFSGDCSSDYYEEGELIRVSSDAISTGFAILDNEDDDDALDGREGPLPSGFTYELHEGELCAIVDGKYIPCEDDYQFQCRLEAMGYED